MRIKLFLVTLLSFIMLPIVALAQEVAAAAASTGEEPWLLQLTQYAIAAIVSLLAVALPPIIKHYLAKSKYTAKLAEGELFDKYFDMGIDFVEEKSRKLAKDKLAKMESNEKLDMGAKFVIDQLKARGIADKGIEYVKTGIESRLGARSDAATSLRK